MWVCVSVCLCVSGIEKERDSVCVSQCECVCVKGRGSIFYINVLECVRVCLCVC